LRRAALALAALSLAGCQTTAERSARLEAAAKRQARKAAVGLSIAHASRSVEVLSAQLVRGPEASAAVITLRNRTGRAERDIPIKLEVTGAGGTVQYANTAAGLSRSLVSIPLLAPHMLVSWVDDQVQGESQSSRLRVELGEGAAAGAIPSPLAISRVSSTSEGGVVVVSGTVANTSAPTQREVAVYAVSKAGAHVLAAGRAVVAELPAGASSPFQIFLVGDPSGGRLEVSAPATSTG